MPPTIDELRNGFELGPWTVNPDRDLMSKGSTEEHLEPMVMDVLVVLAGAQGRVVTKDQLVNAVWGGRATADDTIATKIAVLRHKLGDDSRNPEYIETVSKRGYRLRMAVNVRGDNVPEKRTGRSPRKNLLGLAAAVAAITVAAIVWWPRSDPIDPIDSVAVLQFRNLSDNKARFQYFVDGFSEELVVSLSQVPGLKFAYVREDLGDRSTSVIARALGVEAIVRGSVRTDGAKVRITAELVSKNGIQIWANKIDGAAENIFGFQEKVATEVRDAILGKKAQTVRAASRPANAEAFDRYMRGLFFLAKRDLVSLEHAQQLFSETVQIDPMFGPAYLRQAITLLLLSEYLPEQRGDVYRKALEVARQGAAADSSVSDSMQVVHGFVYHQNGDWADAANAFERAFRSKTLYPTAYHWHSRLLGDLGFMKYSLNQAMAAHALEPASQILNSRVAITYLWNNDMPNARRYFNVANSMNVGAPDHHIAYSFFLIRDGRLDEARASVNFALTLAQRDNWWVDAVIDGLAYPDDQQRLATAYSTIDKMSADEAMPAYIMMTLWALFDNGDKIMEIALQQAAEVGAIYELETIFLDEFDVLREHEKFPQLLQALGLTDYWSSIGCRWQEDLVSCDASRD
ncbi:MAG: winged helix-turn-helix domain-containing protein [Proteobacteria bacterium]|nr:winged helix-turn-helix domain-containing protein [Pseudomonadota bacterium]